MGMASGSSEADYKQYDKLHNARGFRDSILITVFWDITPCILVRKNACNDVYVFTTEETVDFKGVK
jgi:hypothetical protein